MPVWSTKPVTEQPQITLRDWRIFEVSDGEIPSTHFVGYSDENHEGRVSSVIVNFDASTMCGVTKSGRIYKLVGKPGYNPDAGYVWNRWKLNYLIRQETDLTESLYSSSPE